MNLHICSHFKLIDKYKVWMEHGKIDKAGLCCSLSGTKYLKDLEQLFAPDTNSMPTSWVQAYWAYGKKEYSTNKYIYEFTELRQTIVLLICAMHNEL